MFCLIERDSFDRPADAIIHMIQQLILLLPDPTHIRKKTKRKKISNLNMFVALCFLTSWGALHEEELVNP